jgi:cyclophilin family peptidyl-prolyl cis-trans isomerase
VFINLKDNSRQLDATGFAPFGQVTSGMDVVDRLYSSYGDSPPAGEGPEQRLIQMQGNDYLENKFPRLDYIKKATVL